MNRAGEEYMGGSDKCQILLYYIALIDLFCKKSIIKTVRFLYNSIGLIQWVPQFEIKQNKHTCQSYARAL